jgi:hypothetical protein
VAKPKLKQTFVARRRREQRAALAVRLSAMIAGESITFAEGEINYLQESDIAQVRRVCRAMGIRLIEAVRSASFPHFVSLRTTRDT